MTSGGAAQFPATEARGANDAEPYGTAVILAYNEAANLEEALRSMRAVLDALPLPFELLVVDDGSTDGTGPLADSLAVSLPLTRVVHHGRNLGLGGGYRTGFAEARGQVITFFPADGQYPPSIVAQMLPLAADHDLVLGYVEGRGDSALAAALSMGERALYRLLFGPLPPFQGILMLRRHLLQGIELRSRGRGWGVIMELILRAHRGGASIASLPIPLLPRRSGRSKALTLRAIGANLLELLELRLRLLGG